MEINLDRSAVVFAVMALCLWLVAIAPDEVKQQFLVETLVVMATAYWMREHDPRP